MGLSRSDRDLANLSAAARLDRTLGAIAALAEAGAGCPLGLLVNGMTVYGGAVPGRKLYEQLDEENAKLAVRGREENPETWSDETLDQLKDTWVNAYDDDMREDRELLERAGDAELEDMAEDDEHLAIAHRPVTITLADAKVFPPGARHFEVPLLRVRLSQVAAWWLLPTNPDGSSSWSHPSD